MTGFDQVSGLQVGFGSMEEPPHTGAMTRSAGLLVDVALPLTRRARFRDDERPATGGDGPTLLLVHGCHRLHGARALFPPPERSSRATERSLPEVEIFPIHVGIGEAVVAASVDREDSLGGARSRA
jgi:hypothetical protein